MKDLAKTKEQLVVQSGQLRQRIAELEASESTWRQTENALHAFETQAIDASRNGGQSVLST
jgi:phage shock protein A